MLRHIATNVSRIVVKETYSFSNDNAEKRGETNLSDSMYMFYLMLQNSSSIQ